MLYVKIEEVKLKKVKANWGVSLLAYEAGKFQVP